MQVRLNAPMETLASRVKQRREELGLTQTQVAKRSGLKQPDISKIERGDIKKTTELLGLSRALECAAEWLESGAEPKEIGKAAAGTSFSPPVNTHQFTERRAVYRVVSLEAAVEGLARHFESVDGYDKATAISLLSTLANSPDMHAVVAAGLKTLKPQVRGSPSKQGTPAQTPHDSRAA